MHWGNDTWLLAPALVILAGPHGASYMGRDPLVQRQKRAHSRILFWHATFRHAANQAFSVRNPSPALRTRRDRRNHLQSDA